MQGTEQGHLRLSEIDFIIVSLVLVLVKRLNNSNFVIALVL